MLYKQVEKFAQAMRQDMVEMTYRAGAAGAHIGGALSSADVLAVLYGAVLQQSPTDPLNPNRDRFLLSKGHSAIALYAALHQAGFLTEEERNHFGEDGSFLPAHTVLNLEKGIELSSGSLGMGLSFGIGEALYGKKKGLTYKVYVLVGNGECNEGSIWEAISLAAQLKLDHLYLIIDENHQQLDGESKEILEISSFPAILESFGFEVYEREGHAIKELLEVFGQAGKKGKPVAILLHTKKGKGISFMENQPMWHHNRLTKETYEQARRELEEND